ncbi:MAG: NAD(P)-dependent oxidoreductase, partial [Gemmatimonadota bacterium]
PINAYGRSKLAGEQLALEEFDEALVIRTSWVMSGTHRNFAAVMLDLIAKGDVSVVADQRGRPTMVRDLVVGTLDAVDAGASGILHLTNEGSTTWYDLARTVAEMSGLDPDRVAPCSTADYPTPARRPKNSVLDSERVGHWGFAPLPDYHDALEEAVHALLAS